MSDDEVTTVEPSFADDVETPNHPRFPLLLHRGAFDASGRDAAAAAESLFRRNGWTGLWRNGVYPFHHFHPVRSLSRKAGARSALAAGQAKRFASKPVRIALGARLLSALQRVEETETTAPAP